MPARLSKIEKFRQASATTPEPVQLAGLEELAALICNGPLLPTQRKFIFYPGRRAWYTGPVGSAKTTSLIASIMLPAMLYPGSRWFIGRETYWTLQETTQRSMERVIDRLGKNLVIDRQVGPPYKLWVASAQRQPDGRAAEPGEIMLHSLDDPEKLGGMEFNGAGVDECNEVEFPIVNTLDMRLRWRMPWQERATGPFMLRMVSNPVRRSHWLHQKFCLEEDSEAEAWGEKFKSLPKENELNLPAGYYETLGKGMPPEMRIRFVEGECGPDVHGRAVFPDFNYQLHAGKLAFDPKLPLLRGWDFGRVRPACVWAQLRANGQLDRLACLLGDNESLDSFANKVLNRTAVQFHGASKFYDFVDPHGVQRRDVAEVTSIDVLRKMGINPLYRETLIQTGLEYMAGGLNKLIIGRPRSMFDKTNCNSLIEGYSGGYSWPEYKIGQQMKDKPMADGYYEHLMDADRYIEVGVNMGMAGNRSANAEVQYTTRRRK